MPISRSVLVPGLFVGLLSLSVAAQADFTGFLYVSDYGAQNLDRYSYTYTTATNTISNIQPDGYGNNTSSAVFISGGIKEGLQGTADDIIVVNTGGASLTRYDLNGNNIGTIPVKNADGSSHTFNGIGNVLITPDGKYLYAPEEGGSVIDKISLATGYIVASTSFSGAHDLAIAADGSIYATSYSQPNGVYVMTSNLTSQTLLIPAGNNGLNTATGISVAKDGSLYINENTYSGPDSEYHYTISGSGITQTATYSSSTSSSSLHFTFGNNIGPDGNIYIAALGGASGRSGNAGYTDGVYEYNPTTKTVTLAIAGEITGSTSSGSSGLASPKYLQFGTNFVPAIDALYVPEPSGVLVGLGLLGAIGGGLLRTRRRRRTR